MKNPRKKKLTPAQELLANYKDPLSRHYHPFSTSSIHHLVEEIDSLIEQKVKEAVKEMYEAVTNSDKDAVALKYKVIDEYTKDE